jgi:hypothetical protein
MDLDALLDRVNSKETFLEFVAALRDDWEAERAEGKATPSSPYGPGARGWENGSIGAFLDAMHAWADDSGDRVQSSPDWRTFAHVLYAGKFYE